MEKISGRHGHRPSAQRPARGRVQPFTHPGFTETALTSHANPRPEGERPDAFGHRKLIRPNLTDIKEPYGPKRAARRPSPPEQTSAEVFYYLKQMNARTPMVVVLSNGEQLRGVIEWYDRDCLKVNREGAPNLLVLKHAIKYLYKAEEEGGGQPRPSDSDA